MKTFETSQSDGFSMLIIRNALVGIFVAAITLFIATWLDAGREFLIARTFVGFSQILVGVFLLVLAAFAHRFPMPGIIYDYRFHILSSRFLGVPSSTCVAKPARCISGQKT